MNEGDPNNEQQLVTIEGPAIIFEGECWTGTTHEEALRSLMDFFVYTKHKLMSHDYESLLIKLSEDAVYDESISLDGFLTSDGRYVNREVAMEIAKKAEQVLDDIRGGATALDAEDLIIHKKRK